MKEYTTVWDLDELVGKTIKEVEYGDYLLGIMFEDNSCVFLYANEYDINTSESDPSVLKELGIMSKAVYEELIEKHKKIDERPKEKYE